MLQLLTFEDDIASTGVILEWQNNWMSAACVTPNIDAINTDLDSWGWLWG